VAVGAAPLLVHAVTNLLANAIDAVEERGPNGRVEVRVQPVPGAVQVRVSDDGVGISDAVRPHLFQPRFTTKSPGKGTGLGLHLARTAMERCGGSLRLVEDGERASWARTEFAIDLPTEGARG
jgi:signal transduction histidine kinase